MATGKPITIIGGGLAGLTLGIGLRQRDVPVAVIEAGRYPRHRVCGEFISGSGPAVLERLGLLSSFDNVGAFRARTVAFIAGRNHSPTRTLPSPALCLSRLKMDALLATEFQKLGGELRDDTRWPQSTLGEGSVRASGRHAQPTESGWRWFGLKMHVRGIQLTADLEMHLSKAGYVGVNRIDGDEINVCGLFRAQPGQSAQKDWLRGAAHPTLAERLAPAEFDEASFCSVAGLSLKPQHAADKNEVCIGDALTMIPPVTGNGMSMAFESAEIAIAPLTDYSRGAATWTQTQQTIARECDLRFTQRLTWAAFLQRLMFSPLLRSPLGAIALRSDWLWRIMFAKTR